MSGFGGFTEEQVLRYSRHIILPKIGAAGQRKLLDAKVLCVGAGGLGSPVAMYLAAAGVGTLGILDFDTVDLTNLQRQLLHDTDDVGRPKVDSAAERLNGINPDVDVVDARHDAHLRQRVRDPRAVRHRGRRHGQLPRPVPGERRHARCWASRSCTARSTSSRGRRRCSCRARRRPCYRCLFPQPPPPGAVPSCAEAGVFGVLPGIIGSIQAVEAIKLITGDGDPLVGRLLLFDALDMEFTTVKLRWDPDCPVCGKHPTVTELIDYDAVLRPAAGAGALRGRARRGHVVEA